MRKAAVLSGGGALGAYHGGTLSALNRDYDLVAGVSTGAVMAPFVALKKWGELKEGYTNLRQQDIIDRKWYLPNTFKNNGKINIVNVMFRGLFGYKTFGTTNALRKRIDTFFKEEYYNEIKSSGKEIIIATQNMLEFPSKIHYFSSIDCNFKDMKDWIWASANAPMFTSILYKEYIDSLGRVQMGEWMDAGITEILSLRKVIEIGFDEIDVIIHRPKPRRLKDRGKIKNVFNNFGRIQSAQREEIEFNDLNIGIELAQRLGTKLKIYWLPRKLTDNSLLFNSKQMTSWWEEGARTAFDPDRIDIY